MTDHDSLACFLQDNCTIGFANMLKKGCLNVVASEKSHGNDKLPNN